MEHIIAIIALIVIFIYLTMPGHTKPAVMWFYNKNCGHCQRMEQAWQDFANMCPNSIDIKKISTIENQEMATDYGVTGVPYIVKECNGKRIVYNGDRSAMDIYKFATATL